MEEATALVKSLIVLEIERRIFKDQLARLRTRSILIDPMRIYIS